MEILSYCLMTNHIHLIARPRYKESLAKCLHNAHGQYAEEFNLKYGLTGHLWEGRFFSCVLDDSRLWTAIRYVERNPVRAKLVDVAEDYEWSSASAHCGKRRDPLLTDVVVPEGLFESWSKWLAGEESKADLDRIRKRTRTGRPDGSDSFILDLEQKLGISLRHKKRVRNLLVKK